MGSSESKKQNQAIPEPRKYKTRYPKVLYFTAFVGFAIVAWILVYEKFIVDRSDQPAFAKAGSFRFTAETQDALQNLYGRWKSRNNGYIIHIRHVDDHGKIKAAYYNPGPTKISKAQISQLKNPIQIFIELEDFGYWGATYTLTYNRQEDTLEGIYNHPTVEQKSVVVFARSD